MKPDYDPHGRDTLDAGLRALRAMPVPPCPADDDWVVRTFPGTAPASETPFPSRRSLLMRIVPLSAAAAAVVAVGLAAFFTTPASVALGDVIQAARQHKLVKYRVVEGGQTKDGSALDPLTKQAYADLTAPRFRTVLQVRGQYNGALDFESISVTDGTKGVLMLRTTETVTEKGKSDPEAIEILKKLQRLGVPRRDVTLADAVGPKPAKTMLGNLRDLESHEDVVATKGKFRGKDVLRYRVEDGPRTNTLLVDPATKLPVRQEEEYAVPKESIIPNQIGGGVTKLTWVLSDFEWDPPLGGFKDADELFSTEPPAGYQVEDRRKAKENPAR